MTARTIVTAALAALGVLPMPAADGWQKAARTYRISLPRDHASHPAHRIEWWYYTGNLESERGRRFGYQVTFFRIGIDPAPANPSAFAVRDLWMAHAAVTDAEGRQHLFAEQLNRAGVGWAGASTRELRVWNDGWEVRLEGGQHRLYARAPRFAIDLAAAEDRPPVLHGDAGFSQKGDDEGNASHYYSLTRMPTEGHVTLDGDGFAVRGASWMDHEFGTSFLERGQQGWDWFSLQLDDGTDLMMFQLRRAGGAVDRNSSGTVARPGAAARQLDAGEFTLRPGRTWESRATGAQYPVDWTIEVPREGLQLKAAPLVDAQELTGSRSGVSYWEGAIDISGTKHGAPISGRGYLEMTGYSGRALGEVLNPPSTPAPRTRP